MMIQYPAGQQPKRETKTQIKWKNLFRATDVLKQLAGHYLVS